MTKSILPAFSTGVVAPELTSSTELDKIRYGLKECNNMIVDALGGVKNCPGTQYIADAYNTAQLSRYITFQFNTEQAYVLEFGHLKFRILKDGGLVGGPTEVTSPYSISEVAALRFTQSADTLYVFHPDHDIAVIRRTSDTAWTVNAATPLVAKRPYLAREETDPLTTINAKFVSSEALGDHYDLEANTTLFADSLVGDPVRIGTPVPGDTAGIHWHDFQILELTSDYIVHCRAGVNSTTGDKDPITYQQVLNPEFVNGLAFWQEISAVADVGSVTYSLANQTAVLTDPAGAGTAIMEQAVLTLPNTHHIIKVVTSGYTGTGPTLTLNIGTTSGASDILTQVLATGTTYRLDVLPTSETTYISFDSTGSTDGDVMEIDEVMFYRSDTKVSAAFEISTNEWRKTAWNATLGYPSMGVIYEQRLYAANTISKPQGIWVSELGKVGETIGWSFTTPTLSTNSFSFEPSTTDINGILWMVLHNGLKVGTAGEVLKISSSTGVAPTPTDVNVQVDNAVGSLDLKPVMAGNALLITPRGLAAVEELTESFEAIGFVPRNLTVLAPHLFENRRIIRWTYAKEPDSVVWCVLDNGTLLGMTYIKAYDIWAWFTRTTPLGEGFKDVVSIPNSSDDNIDDVYFVINRGTVDAPNYYLEQLNRRITPQTAAYGLSASGTPYDYKFLDSALTLDSPDTISGATKADPVVITATGHSFSDGDFVRIQNVVGMTELNNNIYKVDNKAANTFELNDADDNTIDGTGFTAYVSGGGARQMITEVNGLGHLLGETVTSLADGSVETGHTVVDKGGSVYGITLSQSASFVHVGIPYVSEMETVDIELMTDQGSTQGRKKALSAAKIYFKDSRGADISTSSRSDTYRPIKFMHESDGEDPTPLFTGSKEKVFTSRYGDEERIKIRQTEPLPIHIKRIIPDVDYGG
jgi:hypothetical protein